jgi:hypothetical protein
MVVRALVEEGQKTVTMPLFRELSSTACDTKCGNLYPNKVTPTGLDAPFTLRKLVQIMSHGVYF